MYLKSKLADQFDLMLLGLGSQVLQSALDLGRDRWGHGQMASGGLESVLIGDVGELDWGAIGGGVAELTLGDLETRTNRYVSLAYMWLADEEAQSVLFMVT